MTPEQLQAYRWEREIDERNRPLSDDELDAMFPPGYKVLTPPAGKIALLVILESDQKVKLTIVTVIISDENRSKDPKTQTCVMLL
jgi:hypothetical protein